MKNFLNLIGWEQYSFSTKTEKRDALKEGAKCKDLIRE